MLAFTGVTKDYGATTAVERLDLVVPAGETVVLLGPSGCGKTTILRMAAGLVAPTMGEVTIAGEPLAANSLARLRLELGYVIQEGGLFPHLTGRENLELVARHAGWDRPRAVARVSELSEMARLPSEALARYPHELSGGQRQRVSLMRALFLSPKLLLLDEPLGALDPLIRAGLQADLKEIFARTGAAVLLVTHDLVEASHFADTVCMMQAGRVVQRGSFHEILANPANDFVRAFISSQVVAT